MNLPEENLPSDEERAASRAEDPFAGAEFPEETGLPEDFTPLIRPDDLSSPSRARRRRARRTLIPPGDDERLALHEDLARRAVPSYEFFLFAILSGILLGAGFLLDSDALLLAGALLAPLLTPWVGMTLAVVTGGWRFFFQTLASLLVALLLVFVTGTLLGVLNRALEFTKLYRVQDHLKLWLPDLLVLIAGAVLLELAFMRGERKPILASALLAYALFLPVSAAGFTLGAGLPQAWTDGISIFLTHLALATLAGGIVLLLLHFKPPRASHYFLPVLITLLCLVVLVVFTGLAGWIAERSQPLEPGGTPTPLGLASPTPGMPPSFTPGTPTRSLTPEPTAEPTATQTDTPAPSFAVIAATTGGGANFRTEPGAGTVITTLLNGTVVEVLPEIRMVGTVAWVQVRTQEGVEGWVLQNVLAVTTPAPTATATQVSSPTP